jgi:hypothetical protein
VSIGPPVALLLARRDVPGVDYSVGLGRIASEPRQLDRRTIIDIATATPMSMTPANYNL